VIAALLRIGAVCAIVAWLADRWLTDRRRGAPPDPIRSLVVIDAPIDRVWAYVADIEGQPRWMTDLTAVRIETPGEVRVGTRAVGRVRILGITVDDPVEVTELEPPTRFAIAHEGLFTGSGLITLEGGADGTTTIVRWEEVLLPPLLPSLASLVLRHVLADVFQADLDRLRRLAEAERTG
jgi:uncharacterized protein YndB with AHSA1/START domain